ncbi:hypothetical protein CFP56_017170 [Quercus suber]|uniref:Uncharacterized protein n=1 Tax=Quercus suber TaxID=58331 RepID=A0AAW0KM59_QUESU
MAIGAAEMMLQCVFNGSISVHDMEIERRPYHRNCSCALHKLENVCSNDYSQQGKISLPSQSLQKLCSNCNLYMAAFRFSSQSSPLSMKQRRSQWNSFHMDERNFLGTRYK